MDNKPADEELFDPFDEYYDPDEESEGELEEESIQEETIPEIPVERPSRKEQVTKIPIKKSGVFDQNAIRQGTNVFAPTENPFAKPSESYEQVRRRHVYPKPRLIKKRGRGRPVYPKEPKPEQIKPERIFADKVRQRKTRERPQKQRPSQAFKRAQTVKQAQIVRRPQTKLEKTLSGAKKLGMFVGKAAKITKSLVNNRSFGGVYRDLLRQKVMESEAGATRRKRRPTEYDEETQTITPAPAIDPSEALNQFAMPPEQPEEEFGGSQNALKVLTRIHHTLSMTQSNVEKIAFDTATLVKLAYSRDQDQTGGGKAKGGLPQMISQILAATGKGGGGKGFMEKASSAAGFLGKALPIAGEIAEVGAVAYGAKKLAGLAARTPVGLGITAAAVGAHYGAKKFAASFGEGGFELIQQLRKADVIEYGLGTTPHVKQWGIIEKLPRDKIQILIDSGEFGGRDLAHLKAILSAPPGNLQPVDKSQYENVPEPGIFDEGGQLSAIGNIFGIGEHGNDRAIKIKRERQQRESMGVGGGKAPQISGGYEGQDGKTAMKILMDEGHSKIEAAGIVASLGAESGFNTKAIGDSGQAAGIAQWHPDRQRKFKEVMGVDVTDATFEQQVKFVSWELKNTEKAAGEKLKAAKTPQEAAAIVEQSYERSALGGRGGVQPERVSAAVSYAGMSDEEIGVGVPVPAPEKGAKATAMQTPKIPEVKSLSELAAEGQPTLKPVEIGTTPKEMVAEGKPTLKPVEIKSTVPGERGSLEPSRLDVGEVSLAPTTPTASLIKQQGVQRESLLSEITKTQSTIREVPSEIEDLRKTIAAQPAPQIIQQAAAPQAKPAPQAMPNIMKVRNDDPLLLTLQYSNIRTS